MKRLFSFFFTFAIASAAMAEQPNHRWHEARGDRFEGKVRWTQVPAAFAKGHRLKVWVFLPPQYESQGSQRFPVVYACDGQNLFEPGPLGGDWGMDETLNDAMEHNALRPFIVVGVADDRTEAYRFDNYLAHRRAYQGKEMGGQAERYTQFLLKLKRDVDHDFLTEPDDTGVIGSSLGGLYALYAAFAHPDVFHRAAALSPALWWGKVPGSGELISDAHMSPGPDRLWVDIGHQEKGNGDTDADSAGYLADARAFATTLAPLRTSNNFAFAEFNNEVDGAPQGEHHEGAWSKRVYRVFRWLYRN